MRAIHLHVFGLLTATVLAQLDLNANYFINPPSAGGAGDYTNNVLWSAGSVQTVQWTTTLTSYNLALFQWNEIGETAVSQWTISSFPGNGAGLQNFDWIVAPSPTQPSPLYSFGLTPSNSSGFNSHYFNITSTTKTTTSTSNTHTSTAPTSSTNPTTTSSSTSANSNSSFSTTAKIGLGVGVGVGVTLLLIGAVWLGLQITKKRRTQTPHGTPYETVQPEYFRDHGHGSVRGNTRTHLAKSGDFPPSELSTGQPRIGELGGPENRR